MPSQDVLSLVGSHAAARWNREAPLGTGTVVTFSFPATKAVYDDRSGDSFVAMSPAHQVHIRQVLDVWDNGGGITFVEVPDAVGGDIRFSMYDQTGLVNSVGRQLSGFAYYPSTGSYSIDSTSIDRTYFQTIGGDVFLHSGFFSGAATLAPGQRGFSLLLHEIGHALGFEHSFEGTEIISPGHDSGNFTVMSYNRSRSQTTLGTVDGEALTYLYGDRDPDASWDAAARAVRQTGDGGANWLLGSDHRDIIDGGGGADTLRGYGGDDTISGGAGNDHLDAGEGVNMVDGGAGSDTVRLWARSGSADLTASGGEIRVMTRGGFDQDTTLHNVELFEFTDRTVFVANLFGAGDTLTGTEAGDTIAAGMGSDSVEGLGGDDLLTGEFGYDSLHGGAGNDTILAGDGNDAVTGGPGADSLDGGYGDDRLLGEAGNDTLRGGDGADTLNGGDGDDLIAGGATAADLRDVIYAGAGHDSVDGGHGNDQIYGQGGNDTLAGGFGADTVEGQDGDDVITGSAFGDQVFGNAGNDFVNGGFGHDLINGGAGADKFFHVGVLGHGSDWVQDYSAAEGDVLVFGIASAGAADFRVTTAHTASAAGERAGDDATQEAFVVYRPTGQVMWALVDGGGQASINLQIGAEVFDLLA